MSVPVKMAPWDQSSRGVPHLRLVFDIVDVCSAKLAVETKMAALVNVVVSGSGTGQFGSRFARFSVDVFGAASVEADLLLSEALDKASRGQVACARTVLSSVGEMTYLVEAVDVLSQWDREMLVVGRGDISEVVALMIDDILDYRRFLASFY